MRKIVIAGSTGSIGTQALDVISRSESLEAVGLAAMSSVEALLEQARAHGVRTIALADADAAARAAERFTEGRVLAGAEGLVELITEADCDMVLNSLVGSAGLGPTVAALGEGIDLALANKESLVVGGELVMALAEATGAQLLPVDSEHAALHQLLAGLPPGSAERLVLTASGGPFRGRDREEMRDVTRDEALAHPTWEMGGKITIDSATLMNKGLEVMEAHHLFGMPYERIDVVVHPQSIVHGLVDMVDGATLAHLGLPDMRIAISYALNHPEPAPLPAERLRLEDVGSLTFERVDEAAFPCLRLARLAAVAGGTAPCALNAANEVAVHAFLEGAIPFLGIAEVIERTLDSVSIDPVRHFSDLYTADANAREVARELTGGVPGVSWLLAFAGFSLLVVLHELGHFAVAKWVGMRVEKFSLFFPPTIVSRKFGETEYAIGAIPAGGYVRISGMNPDEDLPPEVRDRAYHAQPVWKRIAVIMAGPAVNLILAFLLLIVFFAAIGPERGTDRVGTIEKGYPAASVLKPGDRLVSVDGVKGTPTDLSLQIARHRCPQASPVDDCRAARPATIVFERDGRRLVESLTPIYDPVAERTRLGFSYAPGPNQPLPFGESVTTSLDSFWFIARQTVTLPARIFDTEKRKEITGVVGSYEVTRQTILADLGEVVGILAIISLSLAIVNLFPFLPLDGGHIFWALVEKVRRRPVPLSVMERSSALGFTFVIILFLIGLTNDIGRLAGEGFQVR